MKQWFAWVAALLLMAVTARSADAGATYLLQVVQTISGHVLWQTPVHVDECFTLSYTHSSAHTPVQDLFRVESGGRIFLLEENYLWYGAGLPFHPVDGTIDFSGRKVRARMHRYFPHFLLRVGTVANHILTVHGQPLPLLHIAKGRERVWIRVVKKTRLNR